MKIVYPIYWLTATMTFCGYAEEESVPAEKPYQDYSLKGAKEVDTTGWECTACSSDGEWKGSATLGAGYSDNGGSTRFNNWVPTHNGTGAVGTLNADLEQVNDDGEYSRFEVEDLGLKRFRVGSELGEYDGIRGSIYYSQSPYYWNDDSLSAYSGDGTTLTEGELRKFDKKSIREKIQIGLKYTPPSPWQPYADMTFEQKEGTYSFYDNRVPGVGSVPGYIQKPLSHETLNTAVGVSYLEEDWLIDAAYRASVFRNDNQALYFGPTSDPFADVRAYEPNNEFHQLSVSGNYRLDRQTVDGRLLWQESTSDGGLNVFPDSPNQKDKFDGKVNTVQVDAGYSNRLTNKASVKVRADYRDRDDRSDKNAVIGQTRPTTDRSKSGIELVGDYRYNRSWKIQGGYDYRYRSREEADRKSTNENTVYISTRYKPVGDWSAGAKASWQDRNGSSWRNDSSSSPNLRQYYLADRERLELRGDVRYQLSDSTQLSAEAWYGDEDYPTPDIGRSSGKDYGYDATIDYQHDDNTVGYAYLNYQQIESKQQNANSNAPDFSRYSSELTDEAVVIGVGGNKNNLMDKQLDVGVDYSYSYGKGKTTTTSNTDFDYPDNRSQGHRLELNGTYRVDDRQSLKLNIRYENYDEDDYLFASDEGSLGSVNQDYDGYFGMVSWEYKY